MLNLMKSLKLILYLFIIVTFIEPLTAQTNTATDSLSLNKILNQVINNFPAIKKNEQELNAANARIGMAKTGYLPDISVNANDTYLGPVSTISLGPQSFSLFPANNWSAALDYTQTVFDFGKTTKNINLENQSKEMVNTSTELIKQRLSLSVVNIYYNILFIQEALSIKDKELYTLKQHLTYIEKKKETGSATQYEVLTTKVRISTIENQKTDLLNSLKVQTCQMNSLMGQPEKTSLLVKNELQQIQVQNPTEQLLASADKTRNELKMAQQKTALSELKYKVVENQNMPSLKFYASGGIKNGLFPDMYKGTWNFAVGVGVHIPIFDANHTKYNLLQVKADIESNKEDVELTHRTIVNEVVESQANMESALEKIKQSEFQFVQAQQAYNLAEISFKDGVITNLELLDTSTSLSEAGLSVLKAKIDYSLSLLKLKIALGERIY